MEALQKQVGPFTVGVWLMIGAAGLALGLVARKAMDGLDRPAEDIDAGPVERSVQWADGAFATQGAIIPMNGGTPGYGGSGPPDDATNDEWARGAIRYLITQGVDVGTAERGIRKYLRGDELTEAEAQAVTKALAEYGLPPRSVPVMKVGAKPTDVPAPPGPAQMSPAAQAWVGQLETDFDWLDAYAAGQVKGDPAPFFARLYGMGVRSNERRISTQNKHRFRAWMRARGLKDHDGKVP